jgi:hypothetical protein
MLNKKQAAYNMPLTTAEKLKQEYRKVTYTIHEKGDAYRNDTHTSEMVEFCTFKVENTEVVTKDGRKYIYMGCRSEIQGVVCVYATEKQYTEQVAVETHTCDHCHTTRERNKYHVFMDESGKIIRVGSTCCNDYFGYKVGEYLQLFLNTFVVVGTDESDWSEKVPSGWRAYDWNAVYSHVKFLTQDFTSYVKESFDYDIPCPNGDYTEDFQTVVDYWKRKKEEEIESSIDGIDTFTWDCESLVTNRACPRELLPLAYAAIYTAKKKLRWEKQRKFTMDELPKYSEGQKVSFSGKVVIKKKVENYFGAVTLVVVDVDGLQHKFFTSSKRFHDVEQDDVVSINAEFLKFDEFNESFSVMVKRPKVTAIQKAYIEQAGE